jgi:tetratricopeptide (TPR) repeat protein
LGVGTVSDLLERLRVALAERYAVERELGQGGSATVFLARDLRHSRLVALKVLRPALAALLGADRFLREIETVARLQHPHILPLYDSGEADGLLFFVMPYVEGESLRGRLDREHQLPLEDAIAITRDVAAALSFAHSAGVVHRDIKPENILLFGGAAVVADFGIARVLAERGARTTDAGLALGTPLYMSPEQASASDEIDARTDVYALGCVLYEMLSGRPPFTAISDTDVLVHHIHDTPQPVSELRTTVPPRIAVAVARALAKLPADRFQTASEFADAVRVPSDERMPIAVPSKRRRVLAVAAVAVVVLAVLARLWWPARLDSSYYLIPPFTHVGDAPAVLTGDGCARRLSVSLERWDGLHVVPAVVMADMMLRAGERSASLERGLEDARRQHAGRLVLGEVWSEAGHVRVRASLYDVAHPARPMRQAQVLVREDPADIETQFDSLADRLVVGEDLTPTARTGAIGTRSLGAWMAFERGDSALYAWNLPRADSAFRAAAVEDPSYAAAWLRSAQVREWMGDEPSSYAMQADLAASSRSPLPPAEAEHARALAALAQGRFQEACDIWRRRTAADASDIFAWYGLGDCLRLDRAVVPDSSSPSGYRFRSSTEEAVQAFLRALTVASSVHFVFQGTAFDRLRALLWTESNHFRGGTGVPPDTNLYAAFAGLAGDTLSLVPYPRAAVLSGAIPSPATLVAAVARSRQLLLDSVTTRWVAAFPRSALAWSAHARALEALNRFDPAGTPASAAQLAIGRARELAGDGIVGSDVAALEARLRLKSGDYTAARAAAERALAQGPGQDADLAHALAGIAGLLGRVDAAARLLQRAASESLVTSEYGSVAVGQSVASAHARLLALASFDLPPETLVVQARLIERELVATVPAPQRAHARFAAQSVPMSLAYGALRPFDDGAPAPSNYLLTFSRLLAHGQADAVRAGLRSLRASREQEGELAGSVLMDGTLGEARLWLALGDSTAAIVTLDGALNSLLSLNAQVLDEVPSAAALVRAMALRADLAWDTGDHATARRWAAAVTTLWGSADPVLRGTTERMNTYRK